MLLGRNQFQYLLVWAQTLFGVWCLCICGWVMHMYTWSTAAVHLSAGSYFWRSQNPTSTRTYQQWRCCLSVSEGLSGNVLNFSIPLSSFPRGLNGTDGSLYYMSPICKSSAQFQELPARRLLFLANHKQDIHPGQNPLAGQLGELAGRWSANCTPEA